MTCDRCEQLAAQLGQVERERDAENAAAYRNASHASRAEDVAHVALARVKELEAEVERLREFTRGEADNNCECECCDVARDEARALLGEGK